MGEHKQTLPPLAFGLASAVLGSIAVVLCMLPIVGVSAAFWGLVAGVVGVIWGVAGKRQGLRWALLGCLLSATAAIMGLTLAYTPITESHMKPGDPAIGVPVGLPYIPPPARPTH